MFALRVTRRGLLEAWRLGRVERKKIGRIVRIWGLGKRPRTAPEQSREAREGQKFVKKYTNSVDWAPRVFQERPKNVQ